MNEPTDEQLMQRLADGDAAAITDISDRYARELRLFCLRMIFDESLADDVVQEVLMTCCRVNADTAPHGSLRGWLYKIVRNRCIDQIRRMRPNERLSAVQSASRHLPALADPSSTPAGKAFRRDRADHVHAAVAEMEDELRSVVIMRFFQGLSTAEIADALELSVSGAKARVSRATRLLRQRLRALDESSS